MGILGIAVLETRNIYIRYHRIECYYYLTICDRNIENISTYTV